ncbi:TolC family protein [Nevskia ramosa]|uniref:TolC family protein n=1 Tax=Nevskia ramosa TaxID=64002 RepID=UPI0003B42F53|nr:TolC family protein [Nevskia ramosa]
MIQRGAAFCAGLALAISARAEAPAGPPASTTIAPLTLDAVLTSSRERYPQVLAAREKIRSQSGKLLSSEGAFDLYAEQTSKSRLSGYYDGRYTSAKIVQPLADFSTDIYGGYKVSGGRFPIYEDEAYTLDAGEFKVGAVFSLLRDRDIDARRAKLRDSRLALDQTALDALLTRVRVQHDAMTAYVDWIAAGEALAVYRGLLQLAEARNEGLDVRVQEGDLANVYLNENRQYILRRRGFVVEAERKLAAAANKLSLYLRQTDGTPRLPLEAELPRRWPNPPTLVDPTTVDAAINAALQARPEIGVMAADLERERLNLALGKNLLKPRVDLNLEAARDFGSGPSNRVGTDAIVRLNVTIPIETRTARGQIDAAQANLSRLDFDRRLLEERIAVEIRTLANDLSAAYRFVELATQEVEQADVLSRAERERFAEGASDFFLVNLREEAAANTRIREIEARLRYLGALADFYAATVQREPLGLEAG